MSAAKCFFLVRCWALSILVACVFLVGFVLCFLFFLARALALAAQVVGFVGDDIAVII